MKKMLLVALCGVAFVAGWIVGSILRLLPIHILAKGILAIAYCVAVFIGGKKIATRLMKES